ncbi:hypothetical protein APHCR_0665 [Anaplasma phagocytophilum str. CR1007]|nr:hypothetical protein YYU_05255 [Anaplasma phagocytophilum str. HZ2]AGR80916.1 hypothetical protein WSQ_05305 [Anaplasma phagocytophilum str. JM]AGR82173.1 hypothetical protein YYY_05320 [Anaplasma phagocytophilum str. Dog2]KDB56371.1 hypothetical protein O997_05310 [Anaplasma phagocytophilum str. MRK]KJV82782.1 hypothetical protein APHHGE2_1483 [Anaplasma phagocytophilum str. HGE2]KJZ99102.1 hypothetical protein APHCR_0665 [Anaplasma phagocytophilum str. CR1007]PLC10313.1 hypothetical prot
MQHLRKIHVLISCNPIGVYYAIAYAALLSTFCTDSGALKDTFGTIFRVWLGANGNSKYYVCCVNSFMQA